MLKCMCKNIYKELLLNIAKAPEWNFLNVRDNVQDETILNGYSAKHVKDTK